MSHAELRKKGIQEAIGKTIEPFSVVLFYSPNDPQGAGGSGTLVTYKGIVGILTASHVVAPFSDRKTIFLPCCLRFGTIDVWETVEVPFCRILSMDDFNLYSHPEWSEDGLDIALIQFENNIFYDILRSWQKTPIDLNEMKNRYIFCGQKYWSSENASDWSWPIAGTPREGCRLMHDESDLSSKNVNFFPNAGVYIGGGECKLKQNTLQKVISKYRGTDADLIVSQIGPTEDFLPSDFSGMSGGGCYQIRGRLIDDKYAVDEFLLAGIFVAGNENEGWLYSRGHISLYEIFCKFLDEQLGLK